MKRRSMIVPVAVAALLLGVGSTASLHAAPSSQAAASGSGNGGQSAASKRGVLRLQVRIGDDDTTAVAKARYEEKPKRKGRVDRKFTVEVQGAQAGQTFEVMVQGRSYGTITADALGVAKLEMRPRPDSPGEVALPADFPRLKAGDTVTIGDMTGALRRIK